LRHDVEVDMAANNGQNAPDAMPDRMDPRMFGKMSEAALAKQKSNYNRATSGYPHDLTLFFKMENGDMVTAPPAEATMAIGHDYNPDGSLKKETWYRVYPKGEEPPADEAAAQKDDEEAAEDDPFEVASNPQPPADGWDESLLDEMGDGDDSD
jgi:hypothetical protein